MKIHQIRNATIIITYNNTRFLIDPWLAPKDYMAGFESAVNSDIRQPRVDLPITIDKIIDVDCVIMTHYHPDHIDEFALRALDKNIPFYVQNECDLKIIEQNGFKNVKIIDEKGIKFKNVELYKTNCQHGRREIMKPLCESINMPYDAMGVVFKAECEKTLYLAGDSIFCDEVKCAIDKFSPEVIIINACAATVLNGERLIMDLDDVKALSNYSKNSAIIASHMDTVSHLTVTRDDIKNLKLNNVFVPLDNEIIEL